MDTATPAPGEQRSLALALANTRRVERGAPVDDIGTAQDARRWLAARAGALSRVRVGRGELERIHALRAAVRELLLALIETRPPDRAALATLSATAAAAPGSPRIAWRGGRLVRDWVGAGGSALDRALAAIAADAIALAADERRHDLIACEAPGCIRVLLRDHNRRRWCSTRCGDRVRAARYHARHAR